jgi:signal recognition particle receptor subunit beta
MSGSLGLLSSIASPIISVLGGAETLSSVGFSPLAQDIFALSILLTILVFVAKTIFSDGIAADIPRNTVLIVGEMDSGKTALFFRIRDSSNTIRPTVTSMKENTCQIGSATLLDFPGHGSLRHRLSAFFSATRAVIFVVDSSREDLQSTTELFSEVASNADIVRRRVPILIVNNAIKKPAAEEQEIMDALCATINAKREMKHSMEELGGGDDSRRTVTLGDESSPFTMDQHPCEIQTANLSVESDDLSVIHEFLDKVSGK